MKIITLGIAIVALSLPASVLAHPRGLNAEGCRNDRKNGGYHCHRGSGRSGSDAPSRSRPQGLLSSRGSGGAFANCSAACAAGAAPVRRGDSGYGRHLDRDNDGVGCE